MSKDSDRTMFRPLDDNLWIYKHDDATRGFVFDTQAEAIASGREKLMNAGSGELTVKGRDGRIRNKDTLGGAKYSMPPRNHEH